MKTQEMTDQVKLIIEQSSDSFLYQPREQNGKEIAAMVLCMEDLRRNFFAENHLRLACQVFNLLRGLKGKIVRDVIVDVTPITDDASPDYNPFGNRATIKVITE